MATVNGLNGILLQGVGVNRITRLFAPHDSETFAHEQAQQLLSYIRSIAPADLVCLYEYRREYNPREPIMVSSAEPIDPELAQRLYRMLREFADDHPLEQPGPILFQAHDLQRTAYRAAMLFPVGTPTTRLGVLGIFSKHDNLYDIDLIDPLINGVNIARMLLENNFLRSTLEQNLSTAQGILATAQAIAENPSPQQVVDILHETLFDTHISSCAMLLYGPVYEEATTEYEYLEIKGTWSKRLGSGVGTGVRLYLRDYPTLLRQLEQQKVLTFRDARIMREQLDPLSRGFLRAERARSVALFALQSARRKLGIIVIATDKRHTFTQREIQGYRTVAEFLAISAMAQTLQQQHDRVQQARAALIESVTDGVLMVSPWGSDGGQVLTTNQQFTGMFNLHESNVVGKSLRQLLAIMEIPEDTRSDLQTEWLNTPVRDSSERRGEFHMTSAEGQPLDLQWYTAPVYQDNVVLGRIYIFHDCTAERTAARLRADFLSRVSHELRTPLTSIQGFAEFILEATGDKLPDLAREYTQIILSSAKHLNLLFRDMIDITRADAGEIQLNKEDAHLPDVIIEVAARLELQYKQRQQKLMLALDDDLPAVNMDVSRISQVMTNLLTNAIKYSPEAGTILIKTDYVTRAEQLGPDAPPDVMLPAIRVTVSDDGKGLKPDEVEKIFMPFFRTEDAKKKKIEGVGLGLSVTRSLIEVHRGKIWAVPNTRAPGGKFQFTLPTRRNGNSE